MFESSRLKIDRAKHHIHELSALILRFQTENAHEIVIEADPEPGYKVHKFRLTKPDLLPGFAVVIGDAINNMRAALDHAVYACALANGHSAPKFRTCSFPFGDNKATFDNAVNGCTAVPKHIQALLRKFEAYENGDIHLWYLNKMCNRDKHALITPVIVGWDALQIHVREGTIESPRNPFWDNSKAEIELFRTKTDPQYDFTISIDIALNSPNGASTNRADGLLNGLLWSVENVVGTIEREMARLGLVT